MLSPDEVSGRESIFEWDGVIRWQGSSVLGKVEIVQFTKFLDRIGSSNQTTDATRDDKRLLQRLMQICEQEDFLFWWDVQKRSGHIALKTAATPQSQLKAWALALLVGHANPTAATSDQVLTLIQQQLRDLSSRWNKCLMTIERAGFQVSIGNLEITSGTRIELAD